jgi:Rab-like protein 2
VFDVTRKATYTNLAEWYKELRVYCENIPVICVANKIDVDEKVTKKAFQFPKKHDLPFYFVSAADGTNVVKVCFSLFEPFANCVRTSPSVLVCC